VEIAMGDETKYFTEDELLRIEEFCMGVLDSKNKKLVSSIMEFLSTKGFITGRQKSAVLGIIGLRKMSAKQLATADHSQAARYLPFWKDDRGLY
jgi:hypothetical protein